jgi:hypothetical protein
VARDFDRILAGIGVRGAKNGGQNLVYDLVSIAYLTEMDCISGDLGERAAAAGDKNTVAEGNGTGPAHPNHGDRSAAARGHGNYGVCVPIHD